MKFILVCGGREYRDQERVWKALDIVRADQPAFVVVTGACPKGVDAFAEQWAKSRQMPYIGVPAQWFEHGKAAGPKRNKQVLDMWKIDYAVSFPGGPGTRHMINQLERAKVPIWRLDIIGQT